jgi:hypothetical protein
VLAFRVLAQLHKREHREFFCIPENPAFAYLHSIKWFVINVPPKGIEEARVLFGELHGQNVKADTHGDSDEGVQHEQ